MGQLGFNMEKDQTGSLFLTIYWNHCQVDNSPKCDRQTTKVLEDNL